MVPVSEMFSQCLQVVHIFGKVHRDMRLENLEYTSLPASAIGLSPGESNYGAYTGLREYGGRDLNCEGCETRTQVVLDHGANIVWPDVANSVFQSGERAAQSRSQMLVSRDDLAEFL